MTEQALQYDASVLGLEVDVGEAVIEEEQVLAYCRAIGETNPLYTDREFAQNGPYGALIAPPAFVLSLRHEPGPDPKVVYGNTTFNAGQHCDFFKPLKVGDRIRIGASVKDIYEKTGRTGAMLFVVRRQTYTNQDGELVAIVDQSTVHRTVDRG